MVTLSLRNSSFSGIIDARIADLQAVVDDVLHQPLVPFKKLVKLPGAEFLVRSGEAFVAAVHEERRINIPLDPFSIGEFVPSLAELLPWQSPSTWSYWLALKVLPDTSWYPSPNFFPSSA